MEIKFSFVSVEVFQFPKFYGLSFDCDIQVYKFVKILE